MGKKSTNQRESGLPVEQYRKNIGKQEQKKNKRELKNIKRSAEKRKEKAALKVKDIILIAVACLAVMVAVYAALYWYLNLEDAEAEYVKRTDI